MSLKELLLVLWCLGLTGCVSPTNSSMQVDDYNGSEWDFDHKLQFKKVALDENRYKLEVMPNHNVPFERLASFLLRKSYRLCGGYSYKIEMLKGIEGYDDKLAMPNYIFPPLTAIVEC